MANMRIISELEGSKKLKFVELIISKTTDAITLKFGHARLSY